MDDQRYALLKGVSRLRGDDGNSALGNVP
ncbi:hypothetical protein LUTEI9C_40050 [Luteimonas sp. 9C]|nr:hypothetical protein LUTEI9C_40050 [Luteimonas sp. 9C]